MVSCASGSRGVETPLTTVHGGKSETGRRTEFKGVTALSPFAGGSYLSAGEQVQSSKGGWMAARQRNVNTQKTSERLAEVCSVINKTNT